MKLKTLIAKLEKARASYVKAHGIEPVISDFTEDEGLSLCARKVTNDGYTVHKKPYKRFYGIKPSWE